ncbi:hypothetical protein [Methylophaga thalassica]|uniref:hypothetical protein n=1 Tax=Methylophaga aminisulfidivorans TaxID=230105 RepID=UPI003A9436EA
MSMIGSIIKSIGAGIVVLALVMLPEFIGADSSASGLFFAILGVYSACIAIGVVIVGVPVHYLLKKVGASSPIGYALVGLIPPVLFSWVAKPFGQDSTPDLIIQSIAAGVIGLACASAFWYFEVRCKNA